MRVISCLERDAILSTTIDSSRDQEHRFALIVTLAFVAATIPRLWTHELWRDEAWMWLVTLDSHSLSDLFGPLARNGQGYLFPILCFIARQLSESPRTMQLVHLVVASSAAYVFTRWAPLTRFERVLLLCGYFTFYEYAVISRHYAVGMLLLWLACVFAKNRPSPIGFGIVLGLACQTTVYAFIVAIAIVCGWAIDRRTRRDELEPLKRRDVAIGATLGVVGAIAGLVQLMPSEGSTFASGWRFQWDPQIALSVLRIPWRAFVPLARFEVQSWNTNILDPWPNVESVAGVAILLLVVAMLRRRPVAIATFTIGASGLLAFAYTKFAGQMRHFGHLWLLFIAAIWLAGELDAKQASWTRWTLRAVLIVHCFAALFASGVDFIAPFTNAPAIVRLAREEQLDRMPMLVDDELVASSLAMLLDRPLYSASRELPVRFPDWGPGQRSIAVEEVRCRARRFSLNEGRDVALFLNHPIPEWPELDLVGARLYAIESSEDFWIWRLRYNRLASTAADAACAGERR